MHASYTYVEVRTHPLEGPSQSVHHLLVAHIRISGPLCAESPYETTGFRSVIYMVDGTWYLRADYIDKNDTMADPPHYAGVGDTSRR